MTETKIPNSEVRMIVDNGIFVHKLSDLEQFGHPEKILQGISQEVPDQINNFLKLHPGKMLPQTSEIIASQFRAEKSHVTLSQDGGEVLFHVTRYGLYDEAMEKYLGVSIEEMGSAISKYEGLGLATRGCREVVTHVQSLEQPTLLIATIKRRKMAMAFKSAGMEVASYHDLPYLAFLTCTCDCSERFGSACPFRRSLSNSSSEKLAKLIDKNDHSEDETDCTFIVSDLNMAKQVNSFFQNKHQSLSGNSVPPGEISVANMLLCQEFFAKVHSYAHQ